MSKTDEYFKYEISLAVRPKVEHNQFLIGEVKNIKANSLVHLAAQLQIVLIGLAEKEKEQLIAEIRTKKDDDIPF